MRPRSRILPGNGHGHPRPSRNVPQPAKPGLCALLMALAPQRFGAPALSRDPANALGEDLGARALPQGASASGCRAPATLRRGTRRCSAPGRWAHPIAEAPLATAAANQQTVANQVVHRRLRGEIGNPELPLSQRRSAQIEHPESDPEASDDSCSPIPASLLRSRRE